MTIKERYRKTINWLMETMPEAKTELHYKNSFQLLVSVILTAQCTDKRINLITPALFKAFPTPATLATSNIDTVYKYIKTVTYPNKKSKYLINMANILIEKFNGEIPNKKKELIKLPGVGRKTANVISSVAFHIPAIAVDTHVFRVSNRIGLTYNSTTYLQTEQILTKYIPKKLWGKAHHWLILHGRYICIARNPRCKHCGLYKYCEYYTKIKKT